MNNNIKQWATLLLTVSGILLTTPLTASAVLKYYTSGTYVETGSTYTGAWDGGQNTYAAPLRLSGSETVYSGTNITLLGATQYNAASQRGALVENGAAIFLYDSVFNSGTVIYAHGIQARSTTDANSSVYVDRMTFTLNAEWSDAVRLENASTGTLRNITVTGSKRADYGVRVEGTAFAYVENANITLNEYWSSGIGVSASAAAVVMSSTITIFDSHPTESASGAANSGTLTLTDVTINTNGPNIMGISNSGSMTLTRVRIDKQNDVSNWGAILNSGTVTGHDATLVSGGIGIMSTGSRGVAEFWDSTLTVSGTMEAIRMVSGTVIWHDGTINVAGDGALLVVSGSTDNTVTLDHVTVSGSGGISTATVAVGDRGSEANFTGTTTVNINGGSGIRGDVTNSGSGALNVNFNNSSLTGNITGSNSGTLNIISNNSILTGDITAADDAVIVVSLDNRSVLTGKVDPVDLSVTNDSTWNMTADSQVNNLLINSGGKIVFQTAGDFKTLAVANLSGGGEFHMNTELAANTGDLLTISGTSAGSHQVLITNRGNNTAGTEPPLMLIQTADGQATFSGTVSVGMFDYSLYQDGNDWYLSVSGTNLPPPTPQPGDVGKDILVNGPGGQAPGWFDHNDNIGNHLTDLRDSAREHRPLGGGVSDKDVTLSAASILDSVWIKAYGAQLNISGHVAGVGVRELDYGTDIGADRQWQLDRANTFIAGAFVGYGRTDRETRNNFGGESNTDAFRLGLYGIWLNNSGWFADVTAKGQYADSHLNAYDASYNHTTADYDNWGGGISANFGKRFDFEHGWFVEPSVSAGYAHLTGSDYITGGDNIFSVSMTDADVFQFKVGVAFGRTIKLTNSGVLQPYLKVGGAEQISVGGKVRASGSEWRPNFDGARAEIGGGVIWRLNADHQLSLDYEASFGDKYDKPWGLTAGYRYQF